MSESEARLNEPQVLIADDAAEMRVLLERLLARQGISSASVASAQDLWAFLTDHAPRIVLLDVELGETDGRDIVRELRSRHPSILPVAVTAHTETELLSSCREAGFEHVLTKPVARADIAALVSELRARRSLDVDAPAGTQPPLPMSST